MPVEQKPRSSAWQSAITTLLEVQPPFIPEGAHAMTVVVEFPPGDPGTPPHRHSGPCFGYVLDGEMVFELEGEPARVVKAGEPLLGLGNAEPAEYGLLMAPSPTDLRSQCELLRSLHRPGTPLLLPNAWDAATAKAVVAAGFPVVATTSGGVAAALGYEDQEDAPADEMLAAAARIARAVEVPVTVDAEAGYGMQPADLVAALRGAGAAGCNLEDTDHTAGGLRDPGRHAAWLRAVRQAASQAGYPLVINARVDVFVGPFLAGAGPGTQEGLVSEALQRAHAYLEAGADCVYPILLWEADALRRFISEANGPVNVVRLPQAPSLAELAAAGAARVSWGTFLHMDAMARFAEQLAALREPAPAAG